MPKLDGEAHGERSRKSTEGEANSDIAVDPTSIELLQRHGSADSSGELEQGDGDVRMETTSDGGSYGPDTLPNATSGLLSANASSSVRRPTVTSVDHGPQHDLPQHLHSSTTGRARPKHLQWAGEQSSLFGSEVTYSYYAFLELEDLWRLLPQDASYIELQGCLRVPKKTILDEFVKQYFLHVHPVMPLLNEGDFWETYSSPPTENSKTGKISMLVFQAMLFAACAVSADSQTFATVLANILEVCLTQYSESFGFFRYEGCKSGLLPPCESA